MNTPHGEARREFEEALDAYLRAEHEVSNQYALDGMNNGGTLVTRAVSLRAHVLSLFDASRQAPARGEVVVARATIRELPTGFVATVYDTEDIAIEFNDPPVEGSALRPFDGKHVEVIVRQVKP